MPADAAFLVCCFIEHTVLMERYLVLIIRICAESRRVGGELCSGGAGRRMEV